jgi:alpha-1,6-mannosyltransferase
VGRYLWDGRVQRLGINPYLVLPADPQLAWTHTPETRQMPSARHKTPYPPASQLFFRMVVSFHDSARAMKLALVLCDLLTILVVWRWLVVSGRSEWLTLAYAWNPLVVLEVAHSGHVDALGALWIAAAAYWLTRRRTALATTAFVFAVATKLLPIVLAPLLWKRITTRDAMLGAALFALLYIPFSGGPQMALGGVTRVVEHIRFNGPVFRTIAEVASPPVAALTAVLLGFLAAAWLRWKRDVNDPGSWAWPMAISLACAPVIYPWYLLYFTPFLLLRGTLPLTIWTFSVVPVYFVWEIARNGGRWFVPGWVLALEYGAVGVAVAAVTVLLFRSSKHTAEVV